MQKITIIILSSLLLLQIIFCDRTIFGYFHGSPWWTYFTYNFFHANIFHLLVNSYALYIVFRHSLSAKVSVIVPSFIAAMLSAIVTSLISPSQLPTIGASAFIYAMVGNILASCGTIKSWIYVSLSIIIGFFFPSINALAHLTAIILGATMGIIRNTINRINRDSIAAIK